MRQLDHLERARAELRAALVRCENMVQHCLLDDLCRLVDTSIALECDAHLREIRWYGT